jgi:flap endonuclease-1
MGIRGLTGWIQWAAAKTLKPPNWHTFKSKRIGIDILGFLYKAKAAGTHPVTYIAHLIAKCREYNIIPIPIFDGKPPDEKRDIIRIRNESRLQNMEKQKQLVTTLESTEMSMDQKMQCTKHIQSLTAASVYITTLERDEVKQMLYACGVRFLNANGEADNVLAYMAKRGELEAVMTNDMDLLTRGVPMLLVPGGLGVPGDKTGWISYNLEEILKTAELIYSQFVEMCVLMGCDYTTKVKSLPYKTAYFQIKYKGYAKTLAGLRLKDTSLYEKAIRILSGYKETAEDLMTEKQWAKWTAPLTAEISHLNLLRQTHLHALTDAEFSRLNQADVGSTGPNEPEVLITI